MNTITTISGICLNKQDDIINKVEKEVNYLADWPQELDDFINSPTVLTPIWKIALEDFLSLFSSKPKDELKRSFQWKPKKHMHLLYWC